MSENGKISQSEMEIMEIIWSLEEEVSIPEISERMKVQKKYTTVSTFVTRLKNKGFLNMTKKNGINVYSAAITKEQYKTEETEEFLNTVHNGSAKSLVASLFAKKINDDDYNSLLNWLDKLE
ncbi:MAG: BlaI/MecI/CopY family transcriptional regulator [Clostridia bacterium]|nr:BlaI/MecI/CopY family transcriptional regulator [Clostridia bacterium]